MQENNPKQQKYDSTSFPRMGRNPHHRIDYPVTFRCQKIPELMRGMGKGVKSFKDGMNGVEEPEIKEDKDKKE